MSNPNKLELVFDCLIDTVERATETENVYNDNDGTSVSWAKVYEVREQLREQNMSNPEIRAIKVLLDELEQEFNPEELSSPNATVKLLDVQITLYDLRKLMIMQERK
jgi:hypothetical protein